MRRDGARTAAGRRQTPGESNPGRRGGRTADGRVPIRLQKAGRGRRGEPPTGEPLSFSWEQPQGGGPGAHTEMDPRPRTVPSPQGPPGLAPGRLPAAPRLHPQRRFSPCTVKQVIPRPPRDTRPPTAASADLQDAPRPSPPPPSPPAPSQPGRKQRGATFPAGPTPSGGPFPWGPCQKSPNLVPPTFPDPVPALLGLPGRHQPSSVCSPS